MGISPTEVGSVSLGCLLHQTSGRPAEHFARAALGLIELSVGRPAEAIRALGPLVEFLQREGITEPGAARVVPDQIEALIALGELDAASELLDWYAANAAALFAPWAAQEVAGYEYYHHLAKDPSLFAEAALKQRLDDVMSLGGTPDKVAAGVQRYGDLGVDQLICIVQVGRVRHDDICESLRLFGKEIIPQFANAGVLGTAGRAQARHAVPRTSGGRP